MTEEKLLRSIDAKLAALLALELDTRLRGDPRTRAKPRALDRLLVDAGLEAAEIARLVGKSPAAVRKALTRNTSRTRKPTEKNRSGRQARAQKRRGRR